MSQYTYIGAPYNLAERTGKKSLKAEKSSSVGKTTKKGNLSKKGKKVTKGVAKKAR